MSEELVDVSYKGGRVQASFDTPRGRVEAILHDDGAVRIRHRCKLIGEGRRLVCDPSLQLGNGHTVESWSPLTIRPSVGCFDCGLHGFIQDGGWSDAGSTPLEPAP